MKKLFACFTMAVAVTLSGHVLAHGDKPKHGDIVQTASDLGFELVNQDQVLTLYVEDHGKKLSTAGATGKLTVLNGDERSEIMLEPATENTLIAKGNPKLAVTIQHGLKVECLYELRR